MKSAIRHKANSSSLLQMWLRGSLRALGGAFLCLLFVLSAVSCQNDEEHYAPALEERDSLPILKSRGVSTLISDSGIIRYKIISEDWFIYDKKTPSYWEFNKGLFIQRFNEEFHTDAYITADTAYYFEQQRIWELHGRVQVKNLKGETFRTSLLYWDQNQHRIYSPAYMRIDGIDNQLQGYDFSSNEQMTQYRIHNSSGATPFKDDDPSDQPRPDPQLMKEAKDAEASDTISATNS